MSCILHIETSTNVCSVALSQDGVCLYEEIDFEGPSHAQILAGFVKETCRYVVIGEQIREIEKSGKEIIYTEKGTNCGWDVYPNLKVRYDNKINERKELVESSDVAAWISESSHTVTGKIMRVCAFFVSIMICGSSIYFLYRLLLQDMEYLIEALRIK